MINIKNNNNNNLKKKYDYKNLLIGGLAGAISRTSTAPLELLKIQQQNYFLKKSQWKSVLKNEGVFGLWKGNYTNCIRIFPQSSINFFIFKHMKKVLEESSWNKNEKNNKDKLISFSSGLISGIISVSCVYPLENARTRLALQMNKEYYNSLYDVFKKTPLKDLYRGLGTSIIGFSPYNAISFMLNDLFKKNDNKKYIETIIQHKLNLKKKIEIQNDIYKLFCGGLSGLISVSITYPTDLIRRRLQIQNMDKNIPKYNGIYDCIKKIYIQEGIYGLYRGILTTYIKIFPAMAIQFYMLESLHNFI